MKICYFLSTDIDRSWILIRTWCSGDGKLFLFLHSGSTRVQWTKRTFFKLTEQKSLEPIKHLLPSTLSSARSGPSRGLIVCRNRGKTHFSSSGSDDIPWRTLSFHLNSVSIFHSLARSLHSINIVALLLIPPDHCPPTTCDMINRRRIRRGQKNTEKESVDK